MVSRENPSPFLTVDSEDVVFVYLFITLVRSM